MSFKFARYSLNHYVLIFKGLPNGTHTVVVVRIVVVNVAVWIHIEHIVSIGRVSIRRITDTYPIYHKEDFDNNIFHIGYHHIQVNQ